MSNRINRRLGTSGTIAHRPPLMTSSTPSRDFKLIDDEALQAGVKVDEDLISRSLNELVSFQFFTIKSLNKQKLRKLDVRNIQMDKDEETM